METKIDKIDEEIIQSLRGTLQRGDQVTIECVICKIKFFWPRDSPKPAKCNSCYEESKR